MLVVMQAAVIAGVGEWGGDSGREATLIICSTALGANNRGTFAPTLEQRTHTNLKRCSSDNKRVKKKKKRTVTKK